jgi:hypothetical protein
LQQAGYIRHKKSQLTGRDFVWENYQKLKKPKNKTVNRFDKKTARGWQTLHGWQVIFQKRNPKLSSFTFAVGSVSN